MNKQNKKNIYQIICYYSIGFWGVSQFVVDYLKEYNIGYNAAYLLLAALFLLNAIKGCKNVLKEGKAYYILVLLLLMIICTIVISAIYFDDIYSYLVLLVESLILAQVLHYICIKENLYL